MQKTWAERLNEQPELVSDADEQLLIYIPCVSPLMIPGMRYLHRSVAVFLPRPRHTDLPNLHIQLVLTGRNETASPAKSNSTRS